MINGKWTVQYLAQGRIVMETRGANNRIGDFRLVDNLLDHIPLLCCMHFSYDDITHTFEYVFNHNLKTQEIKDYQPT